MGCQWHKNHVLFIHVSVNPPPPRIGNHEPGTEAGSAKATVAKRSTDAALTTPC